ESAVLAELANRRGWVVGHLSRDALNRPQDNAGFFPNAMAAKSRATLQLRTTFFAWAGAPRLMGHAPIFYPPPPERLLQPSFYFCRLAMVAARDGPLASPIRALAMSALPSKADIDGK